MTSSLSTQSSSANRQVGEPIHLSEWIPSRQELPLAVQCAHTLWPQDNIKRALKDGEGEYEVKYIALFHRIVEPASVCDKHS